MSNQNLNDAQKFLWHIKPMGDKELQQLKLEVEPFLQNAKEQSNKHISHVKKSIQKIVKHNRHKDK